MNSPTSPPTGWRRAFAVRSIPELVAETQAEGRSLKKTVGVGQLTALGIGATIGTGIFVVIGQGVQLAGPAVVLSFTLAAVACLFSALSYAELASAIPVAGSAYTFSYATLGELVAWIIGWDLILEYGVSAAAVAVGWGGNLNAFLDSALGVTLPTQITAAPSEGGVVNLPAVLVVAVMTLLLSLGAQESSRANMIMVGVKLMVLVFFLVMAFTHFSPSGFSDFSPHGPQGVLSAASVIFFAFIGFDAVSTGSEEARNPGRDLPAAIIGSLVVCTVFYVLVAVGALGIAPTSVLAASDAPLAAALQQMGVDWAAGLLSFGALVAITSVLLVLLYGQTRILFAMSRDGLLPRGISTVSARTGTPARLTVGLGAAIAVLAAVVPLDVIVELVNIGTLFAFILVNVGVIVLRRTRPDMPRAYRVPWCPVFPVLGIAFTAYLTMGLPWVTWARFGVWLVAGAAVYLLYGVKHSRVGRGAPPAGLPTAGRAAGTDVSSRG